MIETVLKAAGLNSKESKVFDQLLRNGPSTVALLLKSVPVKRGDLYNILRRLEEKRLIHPVQGAKKITYTAAHPEAVEKMIKANEQAIETGKENLSLLYSLYNLGLGKPGMRFLEGIEGIKEALNDTLDAETEILTYSDVDGVVKHLRSYNVWYAAERRRRKIHERAIVPDTPTARKYLADYNMEVTKVKFISHQQFKFALEMNIYGNKVSYITFREPFIAVIIEDQAIADTQRAIFELGWASQFGARF